mmetsp:Transcript_65546/g.154113  ORF Transcript_65546/g.154113 Transcript_65546/m.154113 type:complete len:335 (-) Transcript_65546:162-1166(-)
MAEISTEACFHCASRTKDRFLCGSCQEKTFLCKMCFRSRALCGRPGCNPCDFHTDTDLRSGDASSQDGQPQQPFVLESCIDELLIMVEEGKYETLLAALQRVEAYWHFVKARALHAKCMPLRTSEGGTLKEAYHAAEKAVQLFRTLPEEKAMLAEALCLEANVAARLIKRPHDAGFKKDEVSHRANSSATEALRIFKHIKKHAGKAFRVLGVCALAENDLVSAKHYFLHAINEFEKASSEQTVWHAVAYWNMHVVVREESPASLRESLPWLKKATLLQELEEVGTAHPYRQEYRDRLKRICRELGDPPIGDEPLTLSENERHAIEESINRCTRS